MPYQIERPAESDLANGRALIKAGLLMILASTAGLICMTFIQDKPLDGPLGYVAETTCCILSFGLATVLWGLRVYARQAEYRSASRSGMTPAYEAACTMLTILFAVVPVVAGLIALGVIELPTFPSGGNEISRWALAHGFC